MMSSKEPPGGSIGRTNASTPLVIVIMNNNVLGMVRQWQNLFFDKHYSQTTLNRRSLTLYSLASCFTICRRMVSSPSALMVMREKCSLPVTVPSA